MLQSRILFDQIKKKINFFCGVPDSILQEFIKNLSEEKNIKHYVCANEGSAVSLGIGYYLAKKKIPLVYFQNSGLGNAVNPLISIASKKVYSIPMLLLIGWRGSPGAKDEPQHIAKGKITKNLLNKLNIKFKVIDFKKDIFKINNLIKYSYSKKTPVALLIKKNTFFKKDQLKKNEKNKFLLRSHFIETLLTKVKNNVKIISTTGYTSRELHQIRLNKKLKKGKDFYMVGGMGHSSSVSLGYSLASNKQTICLDGDGSMLMHMGSLFSLGFYGKKNLKYIILNNNSHESVGGESTNAKNINFRKLSSSLNFKNFYQINSRIDLKKKLNSFLKVKGPSFLEVKIQNKSLPNLARPKDLKKVKNEFVK